MEIQDLQANVKGLKINYKIAGIGQPILILHGWRHSCQHWEQVAHFLSSKFQVILLDLPGFGKSQDPDFGWTISDYRDFVIETIKELDIKGCILLGHSFGGRIAIKVAALNDGMISKLILCDSAGVNLEISAKKRIVIAVSKFFSAIFNNKLTRGFYKFVQGIIYKILRSDDYNLVNSTMKEVFANATKEDLFPIVSDIKIPTLIIWGELDRATPLKNALAINQKINGSKLEIIKGIGHSPQLKVPQQVADLIINFFYGSNNT